jgi:hypothetical protein
MKFSLIRPALMLALVLGLASCGGKAEFTIGGSVNGLLYNGLVLNSNGQDLAVAPPTPPNTVINYAFPNKIQYGDEYSVTIKAQPQHQTCVPYGLTSDTAGHLASIDAIISCGVNAYSIGGTVSGLTVDGLVLANGSTGGTITLAKDATTFAMASVAYGVTYGVTVQTQPTGLVCSVANGTGTMQDAAVTNIAVTCVPQT